MEELKGLNNDEIRSFLESFDTVLFDCDGIIWKSARPTPTATSVTNEILHKLKQLGKKVCFISNNCTYREEDFLKKLQSFGIDADLDNLAFPTLAIISYLKRIRYDKEKEIVVLGLPAIRQEFLKNGFRVGYIGPEKVEEKLEELTRYLEDNDAVGAVVVDIDLNVNYVKLMKICVYLQRENVVFISASAEETISTGLNTNLIGPGHIVKVLEEMTGRRALGFGKTSGNFNDYIVEKFGMQRTRALFISDRLEQSFACRNGYKSLLVVTDPENSQKAREHSESSQYYVDSLSALQEIMETKL